MKLIQTADLVVRGAFPRSDAWRRVIGDVREAVLAVRWPPDGPDFTIYPESGKSRGKGNGVRPIKGGFVTKLALLGWTPEGRYPRRDTDAAARLPGAFDAHLDLSASGFPPFVVEWETGNIASSHRALNKMALGLLNGLIIGGLLVLPTRRLYRYLTDRVGNYEELEPYFGIWSKLPIRDGYLGAIAVEHDATSPAVPRITKGTDGRALI